MILASPPPRRQKLMQRGQRKTRETLAWGEDKARIAVTLNPKMKEAFAMADINLKDAYQPKSRRAR